MSNATLKCDRLICKCQDSESNVCGVVMSEDEFDQDGMCDKCACNVFEEMFHNKDHQWKHEYRGIYSNVDAQKIFNTTLSDIINKGKDNEQRMDRANTSRLR